MQQHNGFGGSASGCLGSAANTKTPSKIGGNTDGASRSLAHLNICNETPTTRLAHNFGKQITIESAEKVAPSMIPPKVAMNALVSYAE